MQVIERFMCSKSWDSIDYSRVPSQAMRKLKQAFARNDPDRFAAYEAALQRGDPKVKVCASQVEPHELVSECLSFSGYGASPRSHVSPVTQAQWDTRLKDFRAKGSLAKTLVVSDVSGSMYAAPGVGDLPLRVSVGLGLFISQLVDAPWTGHIVTFEDRPQFHLVRPGKLVDQMLALTRAPWGGSTNLQAVFDLVLGRATRERMSADAMPEMIIIVSDMQFNTACRGSTNLDSIRAKYSRAGYRMPKLVFWNVAGRIGDVPATIADQDIALVSGFSPSILHAVMDCEDMSPLAVMLKAVDCERYSRMHF
jgi:hypothetical protein